MPQHAVPLETDILCEHCGYGLNGLPDTGLCPECGEPIADSTTADRRTLPPWESGEGSTWSRFFRTSEGVILSPPTFFRHLQTRPAHDHSAAFISRQHWLCSILFGITAACHSDIVDLIPSYGNTIFDAYGLLIPVFILLARGSLWAITRLATSLTAWEGTYWGYRLPPAVVRRVMNFHSAQLLPVAIAALITVGGYWLLLAVGVLDGRWTVTYLAVISIEVLIAAGYLFRTYWIAMKNVMYANR